MANKRIKKKQQKASQGRQLTKPKTPKKPTKATNAAISKIGQMNARELNSYLNKYGFTAEEKRQIKQWKPKDVYYAAQRRQKNILKKERFERNRVRLIEAGYPEAEANRLKSTSLNNIDNLIAAANANLYLLVFLRDKTGGNVDAVVGDTTGEWSEAIYWQKEMAKGTPLKDLFSGINAALSGQDQVGNIGEYAMKITTKSLINNDTRFYSASGYMKIYQGQGKNYKNLISMINIVMGFLYLQYERDVFIQELVYNLKMLDNDAAQRNAAKIEEKFL